MTDQRTVRLHQRHVRVLLVHDSAADVSRLLAALRKEFLVRDTSDPLETVSQLATAPFASVVCVTGTVLRPADFMRLVEDVAPTARKRVLFIVGTADDEVDCEREGLTHLPSSSSGAEVLAIVRALNHEPSA